MHCYAFLTNDPNVESVLLNAKEPDMPRSTHSKLPHYAAVLAQICQVELQLGRNNFYPLLCKTGLFERSLIGATATFVVSCCTSAYSHGGACMFMSTVTHLYSFPYALTREPRCILSTVGIGCKLP